MAVIMVVVVVALNCMATIAVGQSSSISTL